MTGALRPFLTLGELAVKSATSATGIWVYGERNKRRLFTIFMARIVSFAGCVLAFLTTGCIHSAIGPNSVPRDRSLYSISLADSWKEQTLLNIVKMRYIDPPVFVDIGNIVSSYSLVQSATLGGTIVPAEEAMSL